MHFTVPGLKYTINTRFKNWFIIKISNIDLIQNGLITWKKCYIKEYLKVDFPFIVFYHQM